MRNNSVLREWSGVGLLIFTTIFTLLFSFVHNVDGSNTDYMFYMHLVAECDYSARPMLAGTLMLYKPIYNLFGNCYWLWRMLTWTLNTATLLIPFFALLNSRQQRRYAFVVSLMMLVMQQRFGCEPYKPVYLFASIMLTCFIKYVKDKKFVWISIISIQIALIAFTRLPSIFIYPLMILAIAILNKKHRLEHTLSMVIIPALLFIGLVTITNGNVSNYVAELSSSISETATGGHSIDYIFMTEVESVVHACGYTFFIILPFVMYVLWKIHNQHIYIFFMVISSIIITAIILYHPTQHLSCALMMCVVLLYCYGKHFCQESLILGITTIITAMFCCAGSDCGFVHDYMSACFLPYFAVHTPSIDIKHPRDKKNGGKIWRLINDGLFYKLFIATVLLLAVSTFFNRINNLYKNLNEGGEFHALNAGKIAPNLQYQYLGKTTFAHIFSLQEEYRTLSKKYDDVIFWGMTAHLMGIANNKWPITDVWWIGHKEGNDKAIKQFKEYVSTHHPAIIDTDRHKAIEDFLLLSGYQKISHNDYDVYLKRTD